MPQKNITTTNGTLEITAPRCINGAVLMSTPSTTNAGAVFVCEYSQPAAGGATEEWFAIMLLDPVTKLDTASLTGPSKSGWADIPTARRVRARRTDAGGADGYVNLDYREG